MALSNMQVFSQNIVTATIETLAQQIDKFNAASRGAILLTTAGVDGDFINETFWKSIHSAQRRVDRYAAQGTPSPTNMAQDKEVGVKVAGGFGPILFEPAQLSWITANPIDALEAISANFAEALLSDQLNTAISAARAAIGGQASAVFDAGASGISYSALNSAHAKFGDRSSNIVANVMDGATWHRLVGQNLANAQQLFVSSGVTVVDILGKAVIVTDAPGLFVTGTPNKNAVLGLTANAVIVSNSSDIISNMEVSNGKDRIETTWQADYSYVLKLKGFAWDTVAGGKSPTDAELLTATNWGLVSSDIKHTAGVLALGDAA